MNKLIQNLKWGGIVALGFAFAICGAVVQAQQPARIPRIGYLTANPLSGIQLCSEAFRQGLRELGYEEGQSIIIEWRSAEGKFDRLPALAAELVNLKVDVIVSQGPTATRPLKKVTTTIPIVIAFYNDPVGSGVAASLAQPGGNITGLSSLAPEISGKQLELLKEIVPKLSRVAVLGELTEPGNAQGLKEVELAAGALKVQLQYLDVLRPKDIETSFQSASKQRARAVLVPASAIWTLLTEQKLSTWRQRTGSRRCTPIQILSKAAGL
jgi:putative ABC transport system substrate-binding protein